MIKTLSLNQLTPDCVSRYGVVRVALGQKLSPKEFVEIACRLGQAVPFGLNKYRPVDFPPEVTLLDNYGDGMTAAPRSFGEGWHQDSSFLADPPAFTVLHAHDVPKVGGDTYFADTRLALTTLSAADSDALSTLKLEHTVHETYRITPEDVNKRLQEVYKSLPSTYHPAIYCHQRGDSTLYISPLYTRASLTEQIRPLFERVLDAVLKGQVVHQWLSGDLLAWDNRIVLHAASGYQGEERRRLMRVVVRDVSGSKV